MIYSPNREKTRVFSFNKETNTYHKSLDTESLSFSDSYENDSFRFYSIQKEKYPYKLYLYFYNEGRFKKLDVSKATGQEHSFLVDEKYIFTGTKADLKMFTLDGYDLNEYESSLFIRSKSIFENSSLELLEEEDLKTVSRSILLNGTYEIYVRNGYYSEDEYLRSMYEHIPWYVVDENFKESMLTEIEKQNISIINDYIDHNNSNIVSYPELSAQIDLNSDGIQDNVIFKVSEDSYSLEINDVTVEGTGESLINMLYIFDIDKNDKFREIAVVEAGPSSDFLTHIYYYNGDEILFIESIEGYPEEIALIGDGELVSYKRGKVLQTWFYRFSYILDDKHNLVAKEKNEYIMNTFVILKKDLDVYTTQNGEERRYVFNEDEPALIVSSDDKSWCKIRNSAGKEGYFIIEGHTDINNTGSSPYEYFEGLSFAD